MSDEHTPGESFEVQELEEPSSDEMTPEQLAEAKRYGAQQLNLTLLDKLIDIIYLAVMAFLFARPLAAWLAGYVETDSLRLVVLFLITIGLHECVSFPLSYYSGHVLEKRYQLSNQSFGGWLMRHVKHYLLAVVFGMVMFVGLFWIIWLSGPWWWLVGAAVFFLVSVLLGQLAPVLILPLFYKIERLDNAELSERMARISAGTGLSIEGVYRIAMSEETVKANAMLAGVGRTRRVIMGDTLLEHFSPDEIEVIFAHEIGHHVFHHIRKQLFAGIIYSAAGFLVCDRILAVWLHATTGAFEYSELPVYVLPLLMFILTMFAQVMEPVTNVVSRRYERQCDRYALEKTGLRAAYRSAFRKLAKLNKDDPEPNSMEVFLFHSHPPIAERLAMAD